MSTAHSTKARQRNDRDLAANEQKIETLESRRAALDAELEDLQAERRALFAMAEALRAEQVAS